MLFIYARNLICKQSFQQSQLFEEEFLLITSPIKMLSSAYIAFLGKMPLDFDDLMGTLVALFGI